jgi:enoyl-CoA hydratase/carnithine racemase
MPQRLGFGSAREMLLFGQTMDARRAHAIGQVDHLGPPGEAIAKAIRLRRAAIRDEVRNRFGDEVSACPLSSAASDVQRYHAACSLPGAFAEITDALQRPSATVRTPLDIIRAQTREAAALCFQRECVAAANADPTSSRCRALKAEANGTGGR